jgi:pullulanase
MLNLKSKLGLFVLSFAAVVLAGCGGASGTDSDKTPLKVCSDFQEVLADGTCGEPPPPEPCPEGQIREGKGACFTPDFPPPVYTPGENEAVIYFNDREKSFDNVQLYTWQACGNGWADPSSSWDDGEQPSSVLDSTTYPEDPIYGAYWVVQTDPAGSCGNFIIRNRPGMGGEQTKDLSVNLTDTDSPYDRMHFVIKDPTGLGNSEASSVPICIDDICAPYKEPALAINNVAAHWIDLSTIVWHEDLSSVQLYGSATGEIAANEDGSVANGTLLAELVPTVLTAEQKNRVPHLQDSFAYQIDLPAEQVKQVLKQQLIVVGETSDGARVGTDVQKARVLDDLYTAGANDADEAQLGVSYSDGNVSVAVWAPTAQNVALRVYGNDLSLEDTRDMSYDSATGIWRYSGDSSLDRKFYRFRVTSYYPTAGEVVTLETTDPYSVSLSTNGMHSQFVNLSDADLKPAGWDSHEIPTVAAPEEIAIYEGHIRDFSIRDEQTPEQYRGKYLAFTQEGTPPVEHVRALAEAGINHMHLLPSYDQSSINEDPSKQVNLDSYVFELCQAVQPRNSAPVCGVESNNATLLSVFESYSPFEASARDLANAMAGYDGFNWGYDPQHFNAPDGSYATDPHGATRVLEMRAMNMALHNLGMRVVMDVVYPHTAAAGIKTPNSVFDKLVPGYYYRTNVVTGAAETAGSMAGPDTATEHRMMDKFVSDSVVMWAEQYKVDGFRFDQSGLMPKDTLVRAYEAVKTVDPDNYFYGEAWTLNILGRFSEQANQQNLAGTGIGTFNDRIRDPLRELALVSAGGNENAIRAGLAGNLANFRLVTASGNTIEASAVGAYNLDPQEAVNYVTKHDEETLWDWIHHPGALPESTTLADRVRIQNLTLSVPILSQGVPFFHMGADILRSKSMSRNTYNAGDWFNYVDFTKQTNNWKAGLPMELRDTLTDQDVQQAFIDPASNPAPTDIQLASDVFNEFLRISSRSPLFSLRTAEQVMDRVGFHNSGEGQVDNLIVMSIDDGAGTVTATGEARADLDPAYDAMVVVINGNAEEVSHYVVTSAGFTLHSVQQNSIDPTVRTASFAEGENGGTFTVPAYTTAVFVKQQGAAQGTGLSATATSGYEPPVPYGVTTVYLKGDMNGWGNDTPMTYEGKSVYSVTVTLPAGSYGFKIGDEGWSEVNFGAAADGTTVTHDAPITLASPGSDITIAPSTEVTYRFELDASDPAAPVLTVVDGRAIWYGTDVFVRGGMNSWSTDHRLAYQGDGIYSVSIPLEAQSYQFKVASEDWSTVDLSSSDTDVQLSELVPLDAPGGANMNVAPAAQGTYVFTIDTSNPSADPVLTIQ